METRKKALLFIFLLFVCAVIRKQYRVYHLHNKVKNVKNLSAGKRVRGEEKNQPAYDYNRMLSMIKQVDVIKKTFYQNYKGFNNKKRKPVDVKSASKLLADLYREKVRLHLHIFEMRSYFKGNVPIKKSRTFLYYQKVLEDASLQLQEIVRRS